MLQRRLQAQRAKLEVEYERIRQEEERKMVAGFRAKQQQQLRWAAKRAFRSFANPSQFPGYNGPGWWTPCQGATCRPGQVRETAQGWYVTNGTRWVPFRHLSSAAVASWRPPPPKGGRKTQAEWRARRKVTPLWYRLFGGGRG